MSKKPTKATKATLADCEVDSEPADSAGGVNLKPEAWLRMRALIDESVSLKIKEHTDQAAESFKNVNLQLETIGKRIENIQGKYQTELDEIRAQLTNPSLTTDETTDLRIKSCEKQIDLYLKLRNEDRECDKYLTYHHLISAVRREQRQRSWALRIYGYQAPWRQKTPDVVEVFCDVVQPVLQSMIESGQAAPFDTSFYACVEYAHPLGQGKKGSVPPMIFRFFSRRSLYLFMLNKRSHLAALEKRAADRSQWSNHAAACKYDSKIHLRVSHDLADVNRQTMSFLHTAGIAHKCKTTSAGVSFMPKGHRGKWVKVSNPFSPTLNGLVEPLPDINSLLAAKSLVLSAFESNVPNHSLFNDLKINITELIQIADRAAKLQPAEDGGADPGLATRAEDAEAAGVGVFPPLGGAAAGANAGPAPTLPASTPSASTRATTAAAAAATVAAVAATAAVTSAPSAPTK